MPLYTLEGAMPLFGPIGVGGALAFLAERCQASIFVRYSLCFCGYWARAFSYLSNIGLKAVSELNTDIFIQDSICVPRAVVLIMPNGTPSRSVFEERICHLPEMPITGVSATVCLTSMHLTAGDGATFHSIFDWPDTSHTSPSRTF
jgi:hypothetical protein